jgi:TrmH family RNA methyltransferase
VAEALATPGAVVEWFATSEALAAHPEWPADPAPVVVPEDVLAAMAETRSPQGVLAVCGFRDEPLARAAAGPLAVLLWQIRDPGNAGTILRTADAAGASAVLLTTESVDIYNGKCVRSTAGSLFHVPVVRDADPLTAVRALRASGCTVLAADGAGHTDLYDLLPSSGGTGTLAGPVAWVFGNEARGLPQEVLGAVDAAVSIPHAGRAESLNLAAAAAVCLMTTAAAQAGRIGVLYK